MPFSRILVYVLLLAGALLLLFCSRDLPSAPSENTYLNLEEGTAYVGMQTCRSCHDSIHATFIHTGMGRSFDKATPEKSAATYGKHALVYDQLSNLYYQPYFLKDSLYIKEFRLEGADTVHQRTEKVSYIIGSGQHTNSHIIDINGYIFQAPITYYTQDQKWDMAPGFEKGNERFNRLLATECITCHNHYPEPVAGSLNKYRNMPSGIECERCHGPGEIHAREKLAGQVIDTSQFIDYTIVNPRDLPRELQMDLCQRCHLQGIAVLNEGKSFMDFKPGMPLNEVMNVFLPRYTNSHEKFIMASQADRLRRSPCYQASKMTCITCHNPHKSVKVTGHDQYNNACLSCHGPSRETACSAPQSDRQQESDDCSSCHMPLSGSIDIPHINITDHFISRQNVKPANKQQQKAGTEPPAFLGLKILTKDKGEPLEMAKAYIALFDKYVSAPIMLDSAQYYLDKSKAPYDKKFQTLVHYHFARTAYKSLLGLAQNLPQSNWNDGWTAYRLGQALFYSGNYQQAKHFFLLAVAKMPLNLDFQEKLGATYISLKQLEEAKQTFELVLSENPKREIALSNLGYLHVLQADYTTGEMLYDQAIALNPDYEQALLNKAAVRFLYKDVDAGKQLLERVLQINPANQQAQQFLNQIN